MPPDVKLDPAGGSAEIADNYQGRRVIGSISRKVLDDYGAGFPLSPPSLSDPERLAFVEENADVIWQTVTRQVDQGLSRTVGRFGSNVELVEIDIATLNSGRRLSAARVNMMRQGGWQKP